MSASGAVRRGLAAVLSVEGLIKPWDLLDLSAYYLLHQFAGGLHHVVHLDQHTAHAVAQAHRGLLIPVQVENHIVMYWPLLISTTSTFFPATARFSCSIGNGISDIGRNSPALTSARNWSTAERATLALVP